ncbi:MAG: XdhC family protein [Candidatus Marinimicrobia bacterium]|nr:XdhC family protein [Candidatus Neomarinimicrobiota bacterium]
MIQTLLQQWSARTDSKKAVLCSVVEWKGSVPRKDYPMMLVLDNGSILGTIGGGSMELKVTRAAREMMETAESRLFDFDMTGRDVHADVGLCGGTLKVLVEPFTDELKAFYGDMLHQMAGNPKLMVKLLIAGEDKVTCERRLITTRTDIIDPDPDQQKSFRQTFENQKTKAFGNHSKRYLLWQPFTPPTIHIFGAGHVGQSVAELAHFNDLQVQVYDDRTELMTLARFPTAKLIDLSFPIVWADVPEIPAQDFVLIASREHKHDHELLIGVLKNSPAYVGLVSSARKWKILSESLLEEGITPASLARVHAPVGLNIEAQTVPEIAISIMSEIIAEYRGISQ